MSDGEKDRYGDKLRDAEKGREDQFFADRDAALLQKLKAKTGAEEEHRIRELARLGDGESEKLIERKPSGWLSRFLGRSN